MRPLLLAFALTIAVTAPAAAQKVLTKEPAKGALKSGEVELVDDGSCGPGKIKEVRGGKEDNGVRRTRTCVDKK